MFSSFIGRVMVPAVAIIGLVGQQAWASDAGCWNQDEIPAVSLHGFHTMLMIGALKCRNLNPDVMLSYNAFVDSRETEIEAAHTVLQAHFIRLQGLQAGVAAFKAFDTETGNLASGLDHDAQRCEAIGMYSRLAASATDGDLYMLAKLTGSERDIRHCEAGTAMAGLASPALKGAEEKATEQATLTAASDKDSTEVAQVESEPALTQEQPVAVAVAEAEVPPAPEAQASEPPATPQVAVNDEPVPASDNDKAATALEDAARALAQAAVSLRSASSADR